LHIIENRFKLEREITQGRQRFRPANSHSRGRHIQDSVVQRQVKPSEFTPPLNQEHLRTGIPFPLQLAIESDAEAAFSKGSSRFFKRPHHHLSATPPFIMPSSTPTSDHSSKSNDPLASIEGRQRWASTLLESGAAQAQDAGATSGPRVAVSSSIPSSTRSPSPSPLTAPPQSPGFFTRLQRKSFASLPSAFSNFRMSDASVRSRPPDDGTWSSDSSSSDYPLDESGSRLHRQHSILRDMNGRHGQLSSDENGNADDGLRDDIVDDDYPEQDK
jgi:hypothetical protein